MIPVIALVGRPNVGKSTLFNRLTRTRDALVANYAGLTRDRKYGEARIDDQRFMLIDTGGITGGETGIDQVMAMQSLRAIEEADIVLFLVDARQGLTSGDELIAQHLRENEKPYYLVANKIDGINAEVAQAEFYQLGIENIYGISASHGRGVKTLIDFVISELPFHTESEQVTSDVLLDGESNDLSLADEADETNETELEAIKKGIKIGIIGRPNVGKSTLVNRMLGEERVVVYDHPGTTRDSIYIDYERNDQNYTIIDTAGVRRRKNVKETVEKFSIVKTLKAIDDANVIVLVLDAQEGLVDQDLHLLGLAVDAGRALVVAFNKWDGLTKESKDYIKKELDRKLHFIDYAEIHYISALHGSGVGDIYKSIHKSYESATAQLQTNRLTQILQGAVFDHAPPMVNSRRIKLRLAHAGGHNPPIIVVHGNQTDKVPDHYKRYLEKVFRRELKLFGTPIRIEFKGSDNPFENRTKRTQGGRGERKPPGARNTKTSYKKTDTKKPDAKKASGTKGDAKKSGSSKKTDNPKFAQSRKGKQAVGKGKQAVGRGKAAVGSRKPKSSR